MNLTDPQGWDDCVAANPLPAGLGAAPASWPDHLSEEQLSAGYGACVVIAAGRWMDAMEDELAAHPDADVADVAAACFREVDRALGRFGLTGFQYGAAVSILAQVWEHGEELRRWHNLDTQIGDEGERANETGGVLNPALLNFGPREDD